MACWLGGRACPEETGFGRVEQPGLPLPGGRRGQQPSVGRPVVCALGCCGPQAGRFPLGAAVFSSVSQVPALWDQCTGYQRKGASTGN